MRCPIKKLDPGCCVDFSTQGHLVTDKFRRGFGLMGKNLTDEDIKQWREQTFGKRVNG